MNINETAEEIIKLLDSENGEDVLEALVRVTVFSLRVYEVDIESFCEILKDVDLETGQSLTESIDKTLSECVEH